MAEVKFKITNNDPVTGKRMIAYLTGAPLGVGGYPSHVSYLIRLKENDENTDAVPPNNTDRTKKAYQSYEEKFHINGQKIKLSTKIYLPEETQDPEAITLSEYFATKIISTLPGVGGGDQAWKFAEGILREVILIKQANGEMPV